MRYRFAGVELDTDAFELRADEQAINVEPQVFDVLAYLVAHRDRLVPKEELLDQVWGDRFVSESALTTRIKQARQAVGDDGQAQRVIKTVHGRGYRFVADVSTDSDSPGADVALAPPPPTSSSTEDFALGPVPPTGYVTNDGAAIAYQVFGEGPALVLIGGFVSNVELQWEHPAVARFLRRLSQHCRVVTFDKRGTGVSERLGPGEAPTLDQRADDVRAVMDAVGLTRATILGSSEGGSLSIVFTASHPERVERLILHGTWARHPWLDEPERAEFAWVQRRWGEGRVMSALAHSIAGTEAGRRFLARFERQAATPGTARRLVELMAAVDVTAVLPSISVPTLVVHRSNDAAYGIEHARALVSGIPSARLVELPGTDHWLFSGDTEPLVEAVRSFVAGTVALTATPDRFLTTVLVAGIVGPPSGFAPAEASAARDCVESHRGAVVSVDESGIVSTFDGPGRAVQAGVAMRAALAPLGVELRIGVHTAEVQRDGDTISGIGVEVAEQLARAAEAGAILVSRTVTDLVAGWGMLFTPYGSELDGVPQPLYAVTV